MSESPIEGSLKDPRVRQVLDAFSEIVEENDYLRIKNVSRDKAIVDRLTRIIDFASEVCSELDSLPFGEYRAALICLRSVRDQLITLKYAITKDKL